MDIKRLGNNSDKFIYLIVLIVSMATMTTISLSQETKHKLKTYGSKGDSFEEIINKLMSKEDDQLLREILLDDSKGMTVDEFRKFVKSD